MRRHKALIRISPTMLLVDNPQRVSTTVLANDQVQVEVEAITELLQFLQTQEVLDGGLRQVVLTPDFHKGSGIPVGTVAEVRGAALPKAIGNDVGCGVSLIATKLWAEDLDSVWPMLGSKLRHIFFMGGRALALSSKEREAMLLHGPAGLDAAAPKLKSQLWSYYDSKIQLEAVPRFKGVHAASSAELFSDFINGSGGVSYDAQTGTVGGGNHFVEIQKIESILDRKEAYELGLREGHVAIMVHSGSVSLGHVVGSYFNSAAKDQWPRGVPHPKNGFYPVRGELLKRYMNAHWNATNFAACNRLFLGLMAIRALTETTGKRFEYHVVYDAAHNVITQKDDDIYLHRKGACPAEEGEPVFIPGSMGDHSYVLQGFGSKLFLNSACHGAGRAMRRGQTTKAVIPPQLRIITPLDPDSSDVKARPDVLKKYMQALAQEAPAAYKPVLPALDTVVEAGVAKPVVKLAPLLTVKGH